MVSGSSVDLDKLSEFVDRLTAFNKASEGVAVEVDRAVAQLKSTWSGDAADAHQDYHRRWIQAEERMRSAAAELKSKAASAHEGYSGAVQHNSEMWP